MKRAQDWLVAPGLAVTVVVPRIRRVQCRVSRARVKKATAFFAAKA
jgi:hypothetical protein